VSYSGFLSKKKIPTLDSDTDDTAFRPAAIRSDTSVRLASQV